MDHRDVAAATRPWWKKGSIDERAMTLTAVVWDDNADTIELEGVPFIWEVCRTCNGKGKVVNPNIDRHGITPEEFEMDPQFYEDYVRGFYDVPCFMCDGRRVIPVPNDKSCDPEQLKMIQEHIEWCAQEARETVRENEMGY
jgi:hypothetical protein